jgi:paraquat-inducible protein B
MPEKKKRSARLIGAFVLGGLVLFLAGLVIFSSSNLFSQRMKFVMYFDGSLKGLDAGSPVLFRGVQIGHVDNIVMEIDRENKRVLTPVYVVIDPERFKQKGKVSLLSEPPIMGMIERGLRAQLQTQSLITGQMNIELEFRPSFPARYMKETDGGKLELQKLADTTTGTMETAHAAAYEFYSLMRKLNERIDPILQNVDGSSEESLKALVELQKTLKEVNKAAQNASTMFGSIDREVAAMSPNINKGANNARTAFDELSSAMRALRQLAEYLERNPDALLTGKQDRR